MPLPCYNVLLLCMVCSKSTIQSLTFPYTDLLIFAKAFPNTTAKRFAQHYLRHISSLTHFMPLASFYTPWKHQKTYSFWGTHRCWKLDVSRGYRKRSVVWNALNKILDLSLIPLEIFHMRMSQRIVYRRVFKTLPNI